MRYRYSASCKPFASLMTGALVFVATPDVWAGSATGAATEWTQLANNAQLVDLLKSSGIQVDNQITQISQLAEQIQNQLRIYENMIQNTARLPDHIWGQVENDLNRLRNIVDQGQSISFSMGNADDVLQQRFKSYADLEANLPNAESFSSTYQSWSDIGEHYRVDKDTIAPQTFQADNAETWGAGGKSPLLCFDGSFGSSHGIVFAGSGGFKTTSVTIPTALKWGGTLIVLDPSNEVAPMVSAHRSGAGRDMFVLDPRNPDVGFNVLDWVGRFGGRGYRLGRVMDHE